MRFSVYVCVGLCFTFSVYSVWDEDPQAKRYPSLIQWAILKITILLDFGNVIFSNIKRFLLTGKSDKKNQQIRRLDKQILTNR